MNKKEKVKNIMAFLCILFGESDVFLKEIMNFSPDYIIEKFERYVLSAREESDWGLHPSLRFYRFAPYFDKWKDEINE